MPQFKFYSPEINQIVNSGQNYSVLLKSNGTDAGYQMTQLNGNVTTLENSLKTSSTLEALKNVFSSTGNIAIYNYIISHI